MFLLESHRCKAAGGWRLLLFLLLLLLNLAGLEKPGAESSSCESLRSFAVPVPHLKALLK